MAHYQVFHPDHQIIGNNVLDIRKAIGGDEIYDYYARHGLSDPDPAAWYPLQNLLDVFNELEERGGAMFDLVSIGMNSVNYIVLPPEVEKLSMIELYQLSDQAYRMNHRGSNIGGLRCDVVNNQHIIMTNVTPFPDHLWYGIGYGYARHFLPRQFHVTAYFDEAILRRDLGGNKTVIHYQWA